MSLFRCYVSVVAALACSCDEAAPPVDPASATQGARTEPATSTKHLKPFDETLPTVGLLVYGGVLTTEVTAAADVFTKSTEAQEPLFNVVTIAQTSAPIVTEEGLTLVPDYTFADSPRLKVLFVPSAYDMHAQVHDEKLLAFIREKNAETEYTVSSCAGAQLIGASGIANGKKIVTWIGGGQQLQKDYPELLVQDDATVSYVEDGKLISSNGNLATYIAALELLEKLTSPAHRKFVESYLYVERLRDWKP